MQLLLLFAVISTFFADLGTFLGPAKILFRCDINTDNRVFRVILCPGTLDVKMNRRFGIS
jgi:hypothetical protein